MPSSAVDLYNTFDVYREDLSNGTYLFNIIVQNEIIATGKLLVQ